MIPNTLLIGAQKAGTTGLAQWILRHPAAGRYDVKELDTLVRCSSPAAAAKEYERRLEKAGSVLLDASTAYSMVPYVKGVPALAAKLCPEARIIYIVRDPVQRAISHYWHLRGRRLVSDGPDEALRSDGRFVAFSDYGMQLRPWLSSYEKKQFLVVSLDGLVARPRVVRTLVADHLGLTRESSWMAAELNSSNAYETTKVASGTIGRVVRSGYFQSRVRGVIPDGVRSLLRDKLTKAAPQRGSISQGTLSFLEDRLCHVHADLDSLGFTVPPWDSATRGPE